MDVCVCVCFKVVVEGSDLVFYVGVRTEFRFGSGSRLGLKG